MFVKQLTKSHVVGRLLTIPIFILFSTIYLSAQAGLGCIGEVNFSLDADDCSAVLTPDMLVNASDYNTDDYTYEVLTTNLSDVAMPNNFDVSAVGSKIKAGVRATNIATGLVSNFCWSYVNIEYKFVPDIDCPDAMTGSGTIAVSCLADPANYVQPTFTTSCGISSEVVQIGTDVITTVCDPADPMTVAEITRQYQAVNDFGGFSNICTVIYKVQALSADQLFFPTVGEMPTCSDEDFISDPNNLGIPFHRSLRTGSGTSAVYDTTFLFPTPSSFCNIFVSLETDTISADECEIQVLREWTIQQWLCDNTEEVIPGRQIITFTDEGPEIDCPTNPISVRASGTTCEAFVDMPILNVGEGCSGLKSVRMEFFPAGSLNSNGGNITLPVGTQIVKYIATDECDNESTCEVTVNVSGDAPPVAICEQHVSISLTNSGSAHVPASVFDDGSYGCGFKDVLVSKMSDPDEVFADHLKFVCAEGGSQMVRLRAYNHDDSYNECMTEITINDNSPLSIVCPPNITVSCEFVYDAEDLSIFGSIALSETEREEIIIDAESVVFAGGATEGRDGLATGGCEAGITQTSRIINNTESCGTGSIRRIFNVVKDGESKRCVQRITIDGGSTFDGNIVWPEDKTLEVECNAANVDPDETGRPLFTEGDCQQLAATFRDETFSTVDSDGTCRKIFRYWTIIDWCNMDSAGFPARYPASGEWLQVIKVEKTNNPVVTCSDNSTLFESVESSCMVSDVTLTAVVDGCENSEFVWEYFLDLNCDNVIDEIGSAATFTGTLLAGDHCITWYATDGCGNISNACTHNFTVRNNKGPSAVCISNLTVTLELMDSDNDGTLDTLMQMLWADDVDSGSSQSCNNPFTVSFSRTEIVTGMEFYCNQVGTPVRVGLYVHDDLTGNVGECWTEVDVQDPLNRCAEQGNSSVANVSGLITTESGDKVAQAEVSLVGTELPENMTNLEGQYAFNNMPLGGAYTVSAEKDLDHINGVSTLDLVLIQKHILGLNLLESPYKMIAADINNSNNISAADIVELRKLILGEQSEFNSNTSWRFIDQSYEFPVATNPWSELFPEEYDITSLDQNMDVNFIGVKIGDVSGNASTSNLIKSEVRNSSTPLNFISAVNVEEVSNRVVYSISSSNFTEVNGFQTTLNFDSEQLVFEDLASNTIQMSNQNVGTAYADRGLITLSWASAEPISLDNNEEIFELTFSKIGSSVSAINVSSEITNTEAYFNGNISDVITLTSKSSVGLTLSQNEPNPWKDQTSIDFSINESGYVGFNVLDLSGKLILTKSNYFGAGENKIMLDRVEVPSAGLYFYEIYSQGQKMTKKMIILD